MAQGTEFFKNVKKEIFNGQVLLPAYHKIQERVKNFKVRDDDVWLCCSPKTGSTWCHEMLWMITNEYDYERAREDPITRTPYLERYLLFGDESIENKIKGTDLERFHIDTLDLLDVMESPRCIKTHLFWDNLPDEIKNGLRKPKIIYLTRNPKDVLYASFHHRKIHSGDKVTLDEFSTLFMEGHVFFGPFWKHVQPYWENRNQENILFLTYEEMKSNLRDVIHRVVKFLGKSINEDQMKNLLHHLDIETMRNNKYANNEDFYGEVKKINGVKFQGSFINKGKVGGFKEVASPELIQEVNQWIAKHFEGTQLNFEIEN